MCIIGAKIIRWRFEILNPDWPQTSAFGWTVASLSFIVWLVWVHYIRNFFFRKVFYNIQLFRETSEKKCTRQSRNVIWDMINTLFLTRSCRSYFCCFALALGNIVHGLSYHSFKFLSRTVNSKPTHNTFWDCRVHFLRQPFSKQLYTITIPLSNSWLFYKRPYLIKMFFGLQAKQSHCSSVIVDFQQILIHHYFYLNN